MVISPSFEEVFSLQFSVFRKKCLLRHGLTAMATWRADVHSRRPQGAANTAVEDARHPEMLTAYGVWA
jgi:hypothetical protein